MFRYFVFKSICKTRSQGKKADTQGYCAVDFCFTCLQSIINYRLIQAMKMGHLNDAVETNILFVGFHWRPRQSTGVLQPAGLLYRPLWTFQLWPPDVPRLPTRSAL
jgi:hypothetical protein